MDHVTKFLAVPVLLISVISGQLLTFHVTGYMACRYSETILYIFSIVLYGAELCYVLV